MKQNSQNAFPSSTVAGETIAGATPPMEALPYASWIARTPVLLAALACVLFIALFFPPQAFAEPTSSTSSTSTPSTASVTSADKRAEAEAVLASLNAMQVTLDELSNEYGEALAAQEAAEANRDAAEERLVVLSGKVSDLQTRLRAHAREMYRNGGVTYLDALLKANSFREFATNWDMLDTVNATVADMVLAKKGLAEEEKRQAAVFNEQAAIASEKAAEAESAAMRAQETIADMQATYESLSEEALQLLEEERKAQEAQEAARAQEVLAAAAAAAQSDGASQAAGTSAASSSNATAGTFANPSDAVTAGTPSPDATTDSSPASSPSGSDGTSAPETTDSPSGTADDSSNADSADTSGTSTDTNESTPTPATDETPDTTTDTSTSADTSAGDSTNQDADSGSSSTEETNSTSYEGGSDTVSRAYACLGAPYVWGGVGPKGYDCSGLVSYCLSGSHTRLGTTYTFMTWPRVSNPQPGDIAVNNSHTGIYIGNGQMIHAATYGVGVIIGPVQSGMVFVRYGG